MGSRRTGTRAVRRAVLEKWQSKAIAANPLSRGLGRVGAALPTHDRKRFGPLAFDRAAGHSRRRPLRPEGSGHLRASILATGNRSDVRALQPVPATPLPRPSLYVRDFGSAGVPGRAPTLASTGEPVTPKQRRPQSIAKTNPEPPDPFHPAAQKLIEALTANADERHRTEAIRGAGFTNAAATWRVLDRLLPPEGFGTDATVELCAAALASADADAALERLQTLCLPYSSWNELPSALRGSSLRDVAKIVSFSRFLADAFTRDPTLLSVVEHSPGGWENRQQMALPPVPASPNLGAYRQQLKAWQLRAQLGIVHHDLADRRKPADLFRSTSRIAEWTIQRALEVSQRFLAERNQRPAESWRWTVLALGKLGGRELNFSSDVDLMFVYDLPANEVSMEAQHYFDALCRQTVKFVSQREADGHLYRVDLRLRPEGDTGPLTRSLTSSLRYYEQMGRPWERQMLLKARPIAGDRKLGQELITALRPFIIGPALDVAAISKLKEMRKRMETRAEPSASDRLEIKNGPGGIRDIEFVVQFLQLLHASRHPSVLEPNTLLAIQKLVLARVLPPHHADTLMRSYTFLRRVENRLQMVHELATHHLPTDLADLKRLARSCGYHGDDQLTDFRRDLQGHRDAARAVYTDVLGDRFDATEDLAQRLQDQILTDPPDEEQGAAILREIGFPEAKTSFRTLLQLAHTESKFLPQRPSIRAALADVAPQLVERMLRSPAPALALHNLQRITRRISGKEAMLRSLREQTSLLDIFVDLGSFSPYLADTLVRDPDALDSFVDSLLVEAFGERFRRQRIRWESLVQARQPLLLLNEHKALEILRIGLRDIQRRASLSQTLFALSHLAVHVFILCAGRIMGPEHSPDLIKNAMENSDHTIFFSRIGDQMRFYPLTGSGSKTMCYMLNREMMSSPAGRTPHSMMVAILASLQEQVDAISEWHLQCPLGTDLKGSVAPQTKQERSALSFTVNLFPSGPFRPIGASNSNGKIVTRFLPASGTHIYNPLGVILESPVSLIVEQGRIVDFRGESSVAKSVEKHYLKVGKLLDIDPFVIHSWHAGVNPTIYFPYPIEDDLDRWNGVLHSHPRYAHVHTCGNYGPGEISCGLLDPTIDFDGVQYWNQGKLKYLDQPEIRSLIEAYGVTYESLVSDTEIGI